VYGSSLELHHDFEQLRAVWVSLDAHAPSAALFSVHFAPKVEPFAAIMPALDRPARFIHHVDVDCIHDDEHLLPLLGSGGSRTDQLVARVFRRRYFLYAKILRLGDPLPDR